MSLAKCIGFAALALAVTAGCQPSPDGQAPGADASRGARAAVPDAASATSAPAPARDGATGSELDEATRSLVQGSVKIAASAVACGMGTRAQAEQGFASQREAYVSRGMSGAAYDRAVAAAWDETTGKFAAATPAQKTEACASVAAFGDQLGRMAEDVEAMQAEGE